MAIPSMPIPRLAKTEKIVLAFMVTNEDPTYAEGLSKQLGLVTGTVYAVLKNLHAKNLIRDLGYEKNSLGGARRLFRVKDSHIAYEVLKANGFEISPMPEPTSTRMGIADDWVIYARENFDPDSIPQPSLFLAGPTPRSKDVKSWRPDALAHLNRLIWPRPITIFVPEDRDGTYGEIDKIEQITWEEKALTEATTILFWIPRDLQTLPGFTTNDEWGTWKKSGKVVLGVPHGAPKTDYQIYYANKLGISFTRTLEGTINSAVAHMFNRQLAH